MRDPHSLYGGSVCRPRGSGGYPMAAEYRVYGGCRYAAHLYYGGYGRLCFGKKTIYRAYSCLFPDCLCNGSAEAGNPDPAAARDGVFGII